MLKAIIKFIRPRILTTCYAVVFLGSISSGAAVTPKTVFAIFVLIAWYIHAASTNDYSDRNIDAINLKDAHDRPLQAKDVSYRQLWTINIISGTAALLLASVYGALAVMIMAGMLITDFLYSIKPIRISDRGILSPLVISLGYALYPFALGYWSSGENADFNWLLAIGVYVGFVGRVLLKDFRDVIGDKKFGKLTFVIRHGNAMTCMVSGVFWAASLIAIYLAIRPNGYFTLALMTGFLLGAYFLWLLAKSTGISSQVQYVAYVAKIANAAVLAVITFLLCYGQDSISNTEKIILPVVVALLPLLPVAIHFQKNITALMAGGK